MKKRLLAIGLLLAMLLSLAACGGGGSTPTDSGSNAGSSASPTSGSSDSGTSLSENAVLANTVYVNPNVGKGMYGGTSE